jgi:hypothetical protein
MNSCVPTPEDFPILVRNVRMGIPHSVFDFTADGWRKFDLWYPMPRMPQFKQKAR